MCKEKFLVYLETDLLTNSPHILMDVLYSLHASSD